MTLRVGIDWDRSGSFNWSGTDTGVDPNEYHDVSEYVSLVQCNRGFNFDPLFALNIGQATIKLVNTNQYFDWLVDVNLPIVIQYHNGTAYQNLWAGTIVSYQKETGYNAAFLNLTAKDGGFNISNLELDPNYLFEVNQTNLYIAKKLLGDYSNPINPVWRLGASVLGTTTALGGSDNIPVSGNENLSSAIGIYTYRDANDVTQETRKNPKRDYDVKGMVEDLLRVDGDIVVLDGGGTATIKTYRQLAADTVSADTINLDSEANQSTFGSVDLDKLITVVETSYATKRYDTYLLLGESDGGKIAIGESQEYTLSLAEKVTYTGTSVTTAVTADGSYTETTVKDENKWTITVTNTSGAELTVSSIKIYGEGYITEDVSYLEKKNTALMVNYGRVERKINNGAVDSTTLADAIADRAMSFFAVIRDKITSFTMRKTFLTDALLLDTGDIVKLTESKSGITAKPHLITEVSFNWTPETPEFVFKTTAMSPRVWILGTAQLGTDTYL